MARFLNSIGHDPQEADEHKGKKTMSNIKRTVVAITAALTATTLTVGLTVGPAQAGTVQVADLNRA